MGVSIQLLEIILMGIYGKVSLLLHATSYLPYVKTDKQNSNNRRVQKEPATECLQLPYVGDTIKKITSFTIL